MMNKRKHTIGLAIAAAMMVLTVQAQKTPPPEGGTPHDFKLSEKKVAVLPNGLKTTLVKYGTLPKTSVAIVIKTGNVHEPAVQTGLADFTGKLIKEGTKGMDFKAISSRAASMGGEVSLTVGMEQVMVSGTVLSEFAPDFIRLISDLVMNPLFPESQAGRIKDDILRDLSVQKTVPQTQADEKFNKIIFGNHPYGRGLPTDGQVNAYSAAEARKFYDANFGARRSIIYVVGQYDEKAVNEAIATGLAKWRPGPAVTYSPVVTAYKRDTAIIDRKGAPQTTIQVGGPVMMPTDKDFIAQSVANSLLGGSFGSRITTNIRENKGYTYSPYSYVQNRRGGSIWAESADVTSEHTIESLQEINKEILRLQATPPSKEELQGIQNYEAGIFVLRNTSPDGIISQLNFLDKYGLPDSYLGNYVKSIYAVTPAQVSQITRDRLKPENMTLVLVGDREQILEQAKKFGWKF
jgi:zinc protease